MSRYITDQIEFLILFVLVWVCPCYSQLGWRWTHQPLLGVSNLRQQIDKLQDSEDEVHIQQFKILTKVVQDLEDSEELEMATQMLAKYNLEGERPTWFFCSMNKKRRKNVKFTTLVCKVVDEPGKKVEETLTEQSRIEEEVHNYYKDLYKHREVEHTYDEILMQIGWDVKKVSEHEKSPLRFPFAWVS